MRTFNKFLLLLALAIVGVTAHAAQTVTVADGIANGTVTVDKATATAGETVTITVAPGDGYYILKSDITAELTLEPGNAQAPALKAAGPNVGKFLELQGDEPADNKQQAQYTFVMPEAPYNVIVNATFREKPLEKNFISFDDKDHTTVTVTADGAAVTSRITLVTEGAQVVAAITPQDGYEVENVKVLKGVLIIPVDDDPYGGEFGAPALKDETGGTPVAYTVDGNNYSFVMPDDVVSITYEEKEIVHTYTVAGSLEALFGTTWDVNNTANNMTLDENTGLYTWTAGPIELNGTLELKVVQDHSWDVAFPADNYTVNDLNGTYTVTVTFNPATGEVNVILVKQERYYLIGSFNNWDTATKEEMTLGDDGKYHITKALPAGVEFKFINDSNDKWYGGAADEGTNFYVTRELLGQDLTMSLNKGGNNFYISVAGEWTITADFENMTAVIEGEWVEVNHTYTVAGSPENLFGAYWDPANTAADMTLGDDGLYTWTSEPTFLEGDIELKVVQDHSWNNPAYPANNYKVSGLKPGTYTVTVTFNPETGEVNVTVEGQADVYVIGEVNGNSYSPDKGLKMTSEDGKVYTATVTTAGANDGYSFFDFTHKLMDSADNWDGIGGYRFGAVADNAFLVTGEQMNKALSLTYENSKSFQIPAGEYTLTLNIDDNTLTIAGGTRLAYIIENGVEGIDYTVIDDLALVDNDGTNRLFTSDGNNNWMTFNGGDFYPGAAELGTFKGGFVSGVFGGKDLNPYLNMTTAPVEAENEVSVTPDTYSLADEFAPKINEVINVTRSWYKASENAMRAYAPAPGRGQGQSLTIDNSVINYDFEDGASYKVYGVINIKEPWKTAAPAIGLKDYDYDFQNYVLILLKAELVAAPTAIDTVGTDTAVKAVRYYNPAGVESATPFQGVNIVVKEMNDGSKTTVKAVF